MLLGSNLNYCEEYVNFIGLLYLFICFKLQNVLGMIYGIIIIYKILFFSKYSLSDDSLHSLADKSLNSPSDKLESDEAAFDENDEDAVLRWEDLYFSS